MKINALCRPLAGILVHCTTELFSLAPVKCFCTGALQTMRAASCSFSTEPTPTQGSVLGMGGGGVCLSAVIQLHVMCLMEKWLHSERTV